MDDLVVGKLSWRGSGKDRQRVIICPSKKGSLTPFPVALEELSAELIETEADEIDVEALRDGSGRPVLKVRPSGQEFKPHANVAKTERQNSKVKKMANQFHNPYNFVPAPDRREVGESLTELGDKKPHGHDCFRSSLFTGKVRVKLTVETPLLIPDTARATYFPNEAQPKDAHKSFPTRIGVDGKPHLPVTSVKGMLRSAYEAVTNSRLSIFKEHEKQLAFRAPVEDGIKVVPARIEKNAGRICVTLYTGFSRLGDDGSPMAGDAMYAAWLRRYKWHGTGSPSLPTGLDEHEKAVWAYVRQWRKGPFRFWNVVELQPYSVSPPTSNPPETRGGWQGANQINPAANGQWVEGYICHSNENMRKKHDERVFFKQTGAVLDKFVLNSDQWTQLQRDWKALIEDYSLTDHRGLDSSESRHIKNAKTEKDLKEDMLCYARVVKDKSQAHIAFKVLRPDAKPITSLSKGSDTWHLFELNPVMISRRLHPLSPLNLLPESLRPAVEMSQLSPADRVFGWVKQEGKGKGRAYRGQLRIGTIECKESAVTFLNTDDNLEDKHLGLPLAILGAPKPQQGRFYVSKNRFGDAQDPGLTNEQAGYNDVRKGLRGRKVYPHHANLPDDYWQAPTKTNLETLKKDQGFYREYRRRRAKVDNGPLKEQRDTQNRSVQAWVEKGTFEFDIHFINLSDVELGALLWLLTLNQESNKDVNGHVRYFRLGGGKPLGFGSIRLDLTGFEIRDGAAWREYYGGLADDEITFGSRHFISRHISEGETSPEFIDGEQGLEQLIQKYKEAVKSAYKGSEFEKVSFIAAFLRAATGFVKRNSDEKELPIHYPRAFRFEGEEPTFEATHPLPPHEEGLAYEWFVENNRRNKYPLPDLERDEGLPLFWHRKPRN